jgi:PilZ domain-containing protein
MERRGLPRQRTYKGGRINFETAGADCIIRNLSDGGACLEITSEVSIPDTFRLVIKPECLVRGCEVCWRNAHAHRMGVRFV